MLKKDFEVNKVIMPKCFSDISKSKLAGKLVTLPAPRKVGDILKVIGFKGEWKSHATLTLLATQDLPTFGYNMIDPLKSWCWGSILFYPFKISRFS